MAGARAAHRVGPARPRARVRLRRGGDGHHAQRVRGHRDDDLRPRPQAGRRGHRHQPELPAACSPPGTSARGATASWSRRSPSRSRRRRRQYVVDRFAEAITPRTRVIEVTHITNLTGPDPAGARASSRWRGRRASRCSSTARTPSPTSRSPATTLDCDYYGTSLHKWLLAPIGTGFLYVRRDQDPGTLAADGGADGDGREHPEVRGDRHPPGGEPQRHQRGARLPPRHRRRAEGGAAALPAGPLGHAAAGGERPGAGPDPARLARQRGHRARRRRRASTPRKLQAVAAGRSTTSSPRSSCTRSSRASGSRPTSTPRPTRSTLFADRVLQAIRTGHRLSGAVSLQPARAAPASRLTKGWRAECMVHAVRMPRR